MRLCSTSLVLLLALLSGCISLPERNAGLGLTRDAAEAETARMRAAPAVLTRPVVVLNGYHGLPTLASRVARKLASTTSGERDDFLAISYTLETNVDEIAAEVVERVEARWPSDDPDRTVEVDVVAVSMGGLVARWAALAPEMRVRDQGSDSTEPVTPPAHGKRLRIARLFTLGTPHRGSVMAERIAFDPATHDMRGGSGLLRTLDASFPGCGYDTVCYGQTNDKLVGATRTAPPGQEPLWSSGTLVFSHFTTSDNPLFLADIACRLRGEKPLLAQNGAPSSD
jgi:pimeloyl-ACP methyl ester carboxylesterase